jgi:hypothetical protein
VALDPVTMANYMISQMAQTDSHSVGHNRFITAINSYVTSNIELRGLYTGTGSVYWFDATASLEIAPLMSAAASCGVAHPDYSGYNIEPWRTAMQAEMREHTEVFGDRTSFVSTYRDFAPLILDLDFWGEFSGSVQMESQSSAFVYLCERLCSAYWSTELPETGATDSADGSGVIIWEEIL